MGDMDERVRESKESLQILKKKQSELMIIYFLLLTFVSSNWKRDSATERLFLNKAEMIAGSLIMCGQNGPTGI